MYRPEENVDISIGQGAYYVDVPAGKLKWLQYIIEIPEAGPYGFLFRVASRRGGGEFNFLVLDDKNKKVYSDTVNVPETGDDDKLAWSKLNLLGANLEAGKYAVVLDINNRRFYLDWWGTEGYPEGQSRIELNSGEILIGKVISYKNGISLCELL